MKRNDLAVAVLVGPMTAAGVIVAASRRRERRDRVLSLLQPFLDEPMATTRRSAWGFLHTEGAEVGGVMQYWGGNDAYLDVERRNGSADLLRVILFFSMVHDLRTAGELDVGLYEVLLEPHRQAWAGYTALIAERSGPEASETLFRWR